MKTPTEYLSTASGLWTVISAGSPLCASGTKERAELIARKYKLDPAALPVWDGDNGCFIPVRGSALDVGPL